MIQPVGAVSLKTACRNSESRFKMRGARVNFTESLRSEAKHLGSLSTEPIEKPPFGWTASTNHSLCHIPAPDSRRFRQPLTFLLHRERPTRKTLHHHHHQPLIQAMAPGFSWCLLPLQLDRPFRPTLPYLRYQWRLVEATRSQTHHRQETPRQSLANYLQLN
jgi:hypothetical protein